MATKELCTQVNEATGVNGKYCDAKIVCVTICFRRSQLEAAAARLASQGANTDPECAKLQKKHSAYLRMVPIGEPYKDQ